eukprot:m51a1_g12620 hypothetical protein (281) ;mRNA; r:151-1279
MGGLDSVNVFATVRTVLDAVERVLRAEIVPEDWPGQPLTPRDELSTSRAFDVVAYTASFAILDALRPEWAEGLKSSPEGGVLHEAFADLVAILAQLSSPAMCGSVVTQTGCDLRAANVSGRLQSSMADTLGVCSLRSACSTLTALDVWEAGGRAKETTRSSREVSAMITSAVYGAIATAFSSLLRAATASRAGPRAVARDPAALLYALGKQALSVLVTACVESKHDKADGAPTLHQFCQRLVDATEQSASKDSAESGAFREALRQELQRRHLLAKDCPHQ